MKSPQESLIPVSAVIFQDILLQPLSDMLCKGSKNLNDYTHVNKSLKESDTTEKLIHTHF